MVWQLGQVQGGCFVFQWQRVLMLRSQGWCLSMRRFES